MRKNVQFISRIMLILIFAAILLTFSSCLSIISALAENGNEKVGILNDKKYDNIDELHSDYRALLAKLPESQNGDIDCFPYEIVTHFRNGKNVYVVCTYTSQFANINDAEKPNQDELLIYIVKWEDGYYLELPRSWTLGSVTHAHVELHTNYEEAIKYRNNFKEVREQNTKICYGFAYKNIGDKHDLLFDGVTMDEIECQNPFTGDEFILCYAISNKTYTPYERLFIPAIKQHTIEVVWQEN